MKKTLIVAGLVAACMVQLQAGPAELKGNDKMITEEEKEFLSIFSFISMLSFDVYLKKQMIEQIIDDLLVPAQKVRREGKGEKDKEEKKKG